MGRITILIFSILASSCATGIAHPDSSAIEQVREAVFRFQLKSLTKDQPLGAVYFLSVEGESDPSSTLMGRLVASGFPVKPLSASERTFDGGIHPIWVDRQTRVSGDRLQINNVTFHSGQSATVDGVYGLVGGEFQVQRHKDGTWTVKKERITSIV